MKKILFCLLLSCLYRGMGAEEIEKDSTHQPSVSESEEATTKTENNFEIIDEILVSIYTKGGVRIILQSDLRPRLDGAQRTLRDIVLESLMLIEAELLQIIITEDEIERYLAQIQRENKLTRKALERLFDELGYTYQEALIQLLHTQMIGALLEHKIKSHLVLRDAAVIAYYDDNPTYHEATYSLLQTFIPKDKATLDEIKDLERQQRLEKTFDWEDEFTVQENELAEDRRFIINAPMGSIIDLQETDEGFEITILKAKAPRSLITFEERREDIEHLLRKQRYEKTLHDYEQELLTKATMRFSHEKDKKAILGES
ncbi:MAG: hypothetical protein WA432_03395 [Candidatus Babeliaceae bacterium]